MKNEVYRVIFLIFGVFEAFPNLIYLLKKDGITLARKQHGEIPKNVSNKQMKTKVIILFLFGILFLSVSASSFITHEVWDLFRVILFAFALYAVCEALYYRYWKTFGFAVISISMLVIYLFV